MPLNDLPPLVLDGLRTATGLPAVQAAYLLAQAEEDKAFMDADKTAEARAHGMIEGLLLATRHLAPGLNNDAEAARLLAGE